MAPKHKALKLDGSALRKDEKEKMEEQEGSEKREEAREREEGRKRREEKRCYRAVVDGRRVDVGVLLLSLPSA